MPITAGAHHLTVFKGDIEKLITFYEEMFDGKTKYGYLRPRFQAEGGKGLPGLTPPFPERSE